MRLKKLIATGLIAAMPLTLAACSDEDGDGAVTDEEIEQIDETLEDIASDLEQEVEQGSDEIQD